MVLSEIITAAFTNSYGLIHQWGYIGIFVVSLVSNASLFFFPLPSQAVIFAATSILNPFLVAVFATAGAIIGDSVAYVLGLGGKEILEKKYEREIRKVRNRFERYGAFFWVFTASVLPLPVDAVSIFCGIIKYDFKKYIIALSAGKFLKHLIVVYIGVGFFAIF